jgi:N-methylhydantoinase B
MAPGDRLFHSTGGSGGYGHPFDRPSELVAADVRAGKLTAAAARSTYGVVIDSVSADVDLEATSAERAAVRATQRNSS